MIEVVLTYPTPEGSQEIAVEGEKMSFGRGTEADFRFPDDGLSRLHSTVYRDGNRVWIVDENSTNGTFVNGERVSGGGTPLRSGDQIKIGNFTKLNVRISEKQTAQNNSSAGNVSKSVAASGASPNRTMLITLAVTGCALLIIGVSVIFIGFKAFGGGSDKEIVYKSDETSVADDSSSNAEDNKSKREKTPKPQKTSSSSSLDSNTSLPNSTESSGGTNAVALPTGKKYQAMSDDEKNRYIAAKAEKVARIIGNQASEPIPPAAVQEIKRYVGGYVSRLAKARNDNCSQGGWISSDFNTVLERATKTSPFINRYFNAEGIDPQLGIYVAMIESEHCTCLESPTHAKGMFQFLASSAPDYGLSADQRCEPEAAAKGASRYLKSLIGRFGTAPDSVPLAIASYNSGQGNLSKNLDKVFAAAASQSRSFWTLMANKNIMEGSAGKQFNNENIKYVPKFFATAIIGENPQDFGVNLQPLSTYTK
ncbi:MAG: FHA domain-containing protein [Acidobacteriota bacterium]|nr:FHA domain-containing protein [Acidobacteriota bacterium]